VSTGQEGIEIDSRLSSAGENSDINVLSCERITTQGVPGEDNKAFVHVGSCFWICASLPCNGWWEWTICSYHELGFLPEAEIHATYY